MPKSFPSTYVLTWRSLSAFCDVRLQAPAHAVVHELPAVPSCQPLNPTVVVVLVVVVVVLVVVVVVMVVVVALVVVDVGLVVVSALGLTEQPLVSQQQMRMAFLSDAVQVEASPLWK